MLPIGHGPVELSIAAIPPEQRTHLLVHAHAKDGSYDEDSMVSQTSSTSGNIYYYISMVLKHFWFSGMLKLSNTNHGTPIIIFVLQKYEGCEVFEFSTG